MPDYSLEQIETMNTLLKAARNLSRNAVRFDELKTKCVHYDKAFGCRHFQRSVSECEPLSCTLGALSKREWKKLGIET